MPVIPLQYGKGIINLTLRHPCSIFSPKLPEVPANPALAVKEALDSPLYSPRLTEICKPGDRVVVVVSDITRPVPYADVLPPLLSQLHSAGVKQDDITILFANGTHRLMTPSDAQEILGEKLAGSLHWKNHDALDKENLVYLGVTKRKTPVWVNRLAVEADHVILTGAVVHHYFAGYGGGRKCLIPGIAGMETALANHKLVLGKSCRGLDQACTPGNLAGNPVHEDIMEACKLLPPSFLLNVVLDPDHRVLYATAGDWQQGHAAACQLADEVYGINLDTQAELTIASCGGFPKDINLIQAHKTLDNAFRATAPGKVLLLFAQCSQGIGSEDYLNWFSYVNPHDMEQALQQTYAIHGHTALTTLAKAQAVSVILVSDLDPSLVHKLGIIPANNADDALQKAYRLLGTTTPLTYIFPTGSLTVPK